MTVPSSVLARTRRPRVSSLLVAAGSALAVVAPPATAAAASAVRGRVVTGGGLAQRSAPSTHAAAAGGKLRKGAVIAIDCQVLGTPVDGDPRWYKIHGRDRWVAARHVADLGPAPYSCTPGGATYRVATTTVVRQGPSTRDRSVATFVRGKVLTTTWTARHGEPVRGNPSWVAVEASSGTRGWIAAADLCVVD